MLGSLDISLFCHISYKLFKVILALGMYRMHMQVKENPFHPSRSKNFGIRSAGDNEDEERRKSSYTRNRSQILALIVRLIAFGILGMIAVG